MTPKTALILFSGVSPENAAQAGAPALADAAARPDAVLIFHKAKDRSARRVAVALLRQFGSRGIGVPVGAPEESWDPYDFQQCVGPVTSALGDAIQQHAWLSAAALTMLDVTGTSAQRGALVFAARARGLSLVRIYVDRDDRDNRDHRRVTSSPESKSRARRRAPTPSQDAALEEFRNLRPDETVLLLGETGVGKSSFARRLSEAWCPGKQLVHLNCAAVPAELIESELFGHEQGAFTGAGRSHKGAFERANEGTLFLDEVGELPATAQAKLLTVLDPVELPGPRGRSRAVRRVGGEKEILVSVRLILATNRDLATDVRTGRFRKDLYARIDRPHYRMPSLAEARDDDDVLRGFRSSLERETFKGRLEPNAELRLREFARTARWLHNWRDVEKSAAALARRARKSGVITEAMVLEETDFLEETWDVEQSVETDEWAELRGAIGAERVSRLTLQQRYEAQWLVRAVGRFRGNAVKTRRWLEEQRVVEPSRATESTWLARRFASLGLDDVLSRLRS
jgi:DNA-binding NtrC family response regulator